MAKYDISIDEIKKVPWDGLQYSELTLRFKGGDVNTTLLNALRRILIDNIPTYAFPPEKIQIKKDNNTSKFNNDFMRLRLSQLSIPNIKSDIYYLPSKYWEGIDYSKDYEKHPQEKQIEIYINSTNTSDVLSRVTTSDIQYYEDGILVRDKYNKEYPIVLIELCPGEKFKCHMVSALGVAEKNIREGTAIWSGVTNTYYDETKDGINLTIESQGQCDEYELMWKACKYMQSKMDELKNTLLEKQKDARVKKVELLLDNETYTIGGILTDILQNRSDVAFAGVTKPNHLIKSILIKIEYKDELDAPYTPIYESIQHISDMMNHIEKIIYKIGSKYITSINESVEEQKVKKDKKKK
jgi:DNA-directed RNA polymerase subunit L